MNEIEIDTLEDLQMHTTIFSEETRIVSAQGKSFVLRYVPDYTRDGYAVLMLIESD